MLLVIIWSSKIEWIVISINISTVYVGFQSAYSTKTEKGRDVCFNFSQLTKNPKMF